MLYIVNFSSMFLVPHVGPACKLRIEEGRYIGSLLWDPWDGITCCDDVIQYT